MVINARVRFHKLSGGSHISNHDTDALSHAASRIKDLPIYIDDAAGLDIMDLRARARRRVEVRFDHPDDATRLDPPTGLSVVSRDRGVWHAELDGDIAALKRWLHEAPVRDFTVGGPDLGTIFHAYYREEEA